jgi:hypothetical protein
MAVARKNAYATALSKAMEDENGGVVYTLSDIDRALNFSYEHIRGVVSGENTSFSPKFNDEICQFLGLDADRMWQIAQSIRAEKKFGADARVRIMAPANSKLKSVWDTLTDHQKGNIVKLAESYAAANKIEQEARALAS